MASVGDFTDQPFWFGPDVQRAVTGGKTVPDEPAELIQIVLAGLVENREMAELRI
jgi:hypothetical protein